MILCPLIFKYLNGDKMSVLSVTVRAQLMVCSDGYEVQGRRRVSGGIADLVDIRPKVVVPKSNAFKTVLVDDLAGIWRSLIQTHNRSLVARDDTVARQLVDFCNLYGLPDPIGAKSHDSGSSAPLSNALVEAKRMSQAIATCQGDFIEVPDDVHAALATAVEESVRTQGRLVSLELQNALLAGWFALANRLVNKSEGDWGECDFCGGLKFARAGSRFCSHYCRDRNKKKTARAK